MREFYTQRESDDLSSLFTSRYTGETANNLRKYVVKSLLAELAQNGDQELSNVNLLIDTLNTGRTIQFDHYSNINQLNTVFSTAYESSESSLSARDRVLLRALALPGISLTSGSPDTLSRVISSNTIVYTSEGVPDYTSELITQTGKTTREALTFCFTVLDFFFSAVTTSLTPEQIDYINSFIPNQITPKFDRTTPNEFFNALALRTTPDQKTVWVWKAILIGPAYIAWIAENKWRLDLTWPMPA